MRAAMKKITIILLALSASTAFANRITPLTDQQRKHAYAEGIQAAIQIQKQAPNTEGYKQGGVYGKELCQQYSQPCQPPAQK